MKITAAHCLAAALLLAATHPARAQEQARYGFRAQPGYEESRLGSFTTTIKTARGEKTLHVSLGQLRVTPGSAAAAIQLPQRGLALIQHGAGEASMQVGAQRFQPLEREWLRLTLPAVLSVATEQDTLLMDLILVEE